MGLNTSNEMIEARRLELVASLRLRRRTQREIQQALATQLVNPKTGEAFSLGTINADVKKLEKGWRESAAAKVEEHKAQQLAEIQEVKRQAWNDKDLPIVLRALSLEADITGTKAPVQTEISGRDGGDIVIKAVDYRNGLAAIATGDDGLTDSEK